MVCIAAIAPALFAEDASPILRRMTWMKEPASTRRDGDRLLV
jgi:hypothetical protein